jgi:lipoprotein-anchoring transpeptidase ErfK/SrfK
LRSWFVERFRYIVFPALIYVCAALPCAAASLTADSINQATFETGRREDSAVLVKAQVLLDRAGFSPGVIDGHQGENFKKALRAFQRRNALADTGVIDRATFDRLAATSLEPIVKEYEISPNDVRGPFIKRVPTGFDAMAKLPRLSYAGPREELAEKFHMDQKLLTSLNPRTDFDRSGMRIIVANVGVRPRAQVDKIVIDKQERSLIAFDKNGNPVAFYPASIGSREKPAPDGLFRVRSVDTDPTYHYDPKFGFKGVKAKHKLTIKPGPNNPVGLVWIDLTAPSYGIHGTPFPDKIGKTESHGCIRLTNWDALALASMVHRGTAVEFRGQPALRS